MQQRWMNREKSIQFQEYTIIGFYSFETKASFFCFCLFGTQSMMRVCVCVCVFVCVCVCVYVCVFVCVCLLCPSMYTSTCVCSVCVCVL